ncbi:alpha-1,6-mannosyltransferase NDAI_0B00360 [Naumovozyma dairenensis CBS 421]|uniref:Alpha-1,6-mannosyltransferase MNN11 n=1 Tax=Naumovozyma dairenensis (strain ATCC 10597 / BCRC 20456 / CBS 421 / NBRC 0211 / NRRL Y-12639) TaxID=1071378 RepID=G0W5K9_NAUDC|nr:hypothetical protein NDAI_0B00360 [Naumovozyma dairenensis CBS 421]CCD23070.1 hypothetical protein NDAI_0B00360 [Naumovozyma dairenensis CBS 421]
MVFKPKSNVKNQTFNNDSSASSWFLGLSNSVPRNNKIWLNIKRKFNVKILSLITTFILTLYIFSKLFYPSSISSRSSHTPEHGLYIHELPASSRLIFPHVEHAPVLKEVGINSLYIQRHEMDGTKKFVLKPDDKPLTDDEKKKTNDQVLLVKKSFLDHGKLVYRKNSAEPEIVIVTLIDFENYELESIVKIVQNRVDYAQKHKYGVYIRWAQEFLPLVENQNVLESYDKFKPIVMRAAMHAFPRAKYIFYVDKDSLIMNLDLSLQRNLLEPSVLDLGLLKNVPVIPQSNIRTYNHFNPEDASIIIPQSSDGVLDSSSFIIANDQFGKVFLEYLNNPLIVNFDWANLHAAMGHVLQWHPTLLKKTGLVIPKLLASQYDSTRSIDKASSDSYHYTTGDLIASLKGCKERNSCARDIDTLYSKIKKR